MKFYETNDGGMSLWYCRMCGGEGYVVKSIKFEKGLVKDY